MRTPAPKPPHATERALDGSAARAPAPADAATERPAAGAAQPSRPIRPLIRRLVWARRASQGLFLTLFLALLFATAFRGSFASAAERVRLAWPVELFFLFDPYVALLTLLASHGVYRDLLWALVVVALTLAFGRAFCGWICPFGTLHQLTGWLWPSRYGKGGRRIEQNRTHPVRQRIKYYLLGASLGAALLGSAIGGVLDPFGLLLRGLGLSLLPASEYVTLAGAKALGALGGRPVGFATGWLVDRLGATIWSPEQLIAHAGWLLGALLIALLLLNRVVPRFFCRVLCPLGALLGILARFSLFGMRKEHARCTDCNLCLLHCQGADSPQGGARWRQDECHLCLNCEAVCPEGVIHFGWLPPRGDSIRKPDTVRRTAVASLAAGAALVPLTRASDGFGSNSYDRRIRPPGSVDEPEFLARCIRCGECMKVCPNNALHPALLETGVEGLWTPLLVPRIGYCEQTCVLCSQVCPTGAIRRIKEEARLGIDQEPIVIGTAFFDRGRCLPWAMATPCIVCEEFCPTSPKAIWTEEVEVPVRPAAGASHETNVAPSKVKVRQPHLDPNRCIGCGACEHVCPIKDRPAVYVLATGESRTKRNAMLL